MRSRPERVSCLSGATIAAKGGGGLILRECKDEGRGRGWGLPLISLMVKLRSLDGASPVIFWGVKTAVSMKTGGVEVAMCNLGWKFFL